MYETPLYTYTQQPCYSTEGISASTHMLVEGRHLYGRYLRNSATHTKTNLNEGTAQHLQGKIYIC